MVADEILVCRHSPLGSQAAVFPPWKLARGDFGLIKVYGEPTMDVA